LLEVSREINADTLTKYLTSPVQSYLPILAPKETEKVDHIELEMLLNVLKEMRQELNDLKEQVLHLSGHSQLSKPSHFIKPSYPKNIDIEPNVKLVHKSMADQDGPFETPIIIDDSYSLQDNEKELIKRSLEKHNGKRKEAAHELGISERTLYRKIKEFEI